MPMRHGESILLMLYVPDYFGRQDRVKATAKLIRKYIAEPKDLNWLLEDNTHRQYKAKQGRTKRSKYSLSPLFSEDRRLTLPKIRLPMIQYKKISLIDKALNKNAHSLLTTRHKEHSELKQSKQTKAVNRSARVAHLRKSELQSSVPYSRSPTLEPWLNDHVSIIAS